MPYIQTDNLGYVLTNSSLPTFLYSPNLSWGFEGLAGMGGKRYLHYPKMNFYTNDDGTVRAFGHESIPIVNRRGVNYIEIPVDGDNEISTWWTGNNQHSVQNYYRIPVGKTTKYVAPPVLQPKPKQTEEKQKTTEKLTKIVITKPKPESKPKPTLVKKPIPIPDDVKEGLVKVVDGTPYYELDGDPEEITKLIEEYIEKNGLKDDNVYIDTDTEPEKTYTDDGNNTTYNKTSNKTDVQDTSVNNEDVYFRTDSYGKAKTVLVKQGDEGAYLYKYPHRHVNIYKVSPELAKYVLDKLSNKTQPIEPGRLGFIYSTVPLKNLPNGELNDTTFHDIFTLPKNSEWIDFFDGTIAHDTRTLYADAAVAQGYHTTDGLPVTLIDDYPILEVDELPIEDNKVFVRLFYFRDGTPFTYSSDYIPYPDHTLSYDYLRKYSKDNNMLDFATDIHGKKHFIIYPSFDLDNEHHLGPLRDIISIQSHQAVKDSLEQVRLQNNDSTPKGSWWNRLIGKNNKGGTLNKRQLCQRII